MGSGRFDHTAYRGFTARSENLSRDQVFTSRSIKKELNPFGVKVRESRDSPDNPNSNAIIVAVDVTGSMGMLAEVIARKGLGTLFEELLGDKSPVVDPHLMFMGIGDANCDQAPLQVSQFEADIRIIEQLTGIWIEHGGGGNDSESYHFPWYFAAEHTSIDCWEKRGKKGYLFTVGDESTPTPLLKSQIEHFISDTPQQDYTAEQLLAKASETYHCFHIIIEEGSYARGHVDEVLKAWTSLMGQTALSLKDHTKLAEGIIAIIKMNEASLGHGRAPLATASLPGYIGLLR